MKNAVQEFLLHGGTIEQLKDQYGINSRRHGKYPNLVLFKYDQIESPMGEKIVQHARGVILDEAKSWGIVAWPMNKFFNHGEVHAAKIDWRKARVQEKLDGSLATVYFYDDLWHMATSGTPDATGEAHGSGKSFSDYFWETLQKYPSLYNLFKQNGVKEHVTFNFELMGPINRIVVVHTESKLALLSARNNQTGEEFSAKEANLLYLQNYAPCVRDFNLNSIESIMASFEFISPLSQEGYVVFAPGVDGQLDREKIKHPSYIALHHAKDGMTTKAFVEIVRKGEVSEVLTAFPEYLPLMEEVQRRYQTFLAQVEADYERLKDIPVQKDFAAEALQTRCSGALFAFRSKKVPSLKAFLQNMQVDKLLEYLGY